MTTYAETEHQDTILRSDGAFIPVDDANTDYQDYLRWVDKGGKITPYVAPPLTLEQRNATILAQIHALDLKRIRPLAEGDTSYLTTLNDQIIVLRAMLK